MLTHTYISYKRGKLIKGAMLIFCLFFITFLPGTRVCLAASKAKSIFSRPKWMQKTPAEKKASKGTEVQKKVSQKFFYPSQIKIPQDLAKIQESYQGKKKKLIIHIQDAHCNYDGQKKSAKILEELIKNYGLKLILVEGGSGDVSLSYLRNYGTQELREKVAEEYLKKGEIAGEEYLDIVSDLPFNLYGVETDELYNVHLATFWKVEETKNKMLKGTSELKTLADDLKQRVYNKDLKELEQRKADYEEERITVVDYYDYLGTLAQKLNVDLTETPEFKKFIEAARFEKDIKSEGITADAKELIEKLVKVLPEKKLKQLLAKSAKFKLKKVTSHEYYSFLKLSALSAHLNLKAYPNLYNYLNYLELSDAIDGPGLIKQVKEVEGAIKEKLFRNSEEKELDKISGNLIILTNLINLQLTPEEHSLYKGNKSDFQPKVWLKFLNDKASKYKLTEVKVDTKLIENNLGQSEEYYQAALKRDAAILENSLNKMEQDGEPIAVLIAGGFHTPRLTEMIRTKDYSYLVVAPKISESADHNLYISVLKNREPLGK